MENSNKEINHISVHEAGHAICGYILGGVLVWVAIVQVGSGDYQDENEDTLGSTKCEFPKPWKSGSMRDAEKISAYVEFCEKSVCQSYAGVLAEEIIFGKWPNEGYGGDFENIRRFIEVIQFHTSESPRAIDERLRLTAQQQLSTPLAKNAVKVLADALRQRKRIDGAQASEIIRSALEEDNR